MSIFASFSESLSPQPARAGASICWTASLATRRTPPTFTDGSVLEEIQRRTVLTDTPDRRAISPARKAARLNPIEALRVLGGWVRQVHIKDAVRTKVPGTWGEEVPVGTGQVDWRAFIATLNAHNSTCDLVIEREAGQQRVADIRFARQTLERIAV